MSSPELERLYYEGVAAIRAGDKLTGRAKLQQVIEQDQLHEDAWLWLSAAVDTDEERIICLENVLTINPAHAAARRGLERLGGTPPPLPPEPTPPPKAPSEQPPEYTAAETIGQDLDAVMSVVPKQERPAAKQPKPKEDEAWRAALYDSDHVSSEAAWVPSATLPPKRSLLDLVAVWGKLSYFNIYDGFKDEADHGGFVHILINIAAAGVLQTISSFILVFLLFILPASGNFQPRLMTSLLERFEGIFVEMGGRIDNQVDSSVLGTLDQQGVYGTPDYSQVLGEMEEELRQVLSVMGTAALFSSLASIPMLFVAQFFQGFMTNAVAMWLRGKGDIIKTLHAMTLALVVGQLVELPLNLILPFVTFQIALTLGAIVWVYQFAVTAVALGAVHDFNLPLSMAALMMSSALGGTVASGGMCLIGYLISALG